MTHLDLLLSLMRITIVASIALGIGFILLRRRPDSVPALALTALLSGCVLMAITGATWPTVWHATFPAQSPRTEQHGETRTSDRSVSESPGVEFSWDRLTGIVQRLDTTTHRDSTISVRVFLAALVGLLLLSLIRLACGLTATLLLHRTSRPATHERLSNLIVQLKTSELTFRVNSRIDAPCVTAFDRQAIYLPETWNDYSDDELLASLAHEVAHLQRRDARWRLLAQLATALQVFHPLAHRLLRQLILGQELSADAHAARLIGPQRVIHGISQLALRLDAGANMRPSPAVGMSHSSSFLIRRITMLRKGMPDAERRMTSRLSRMMALAVLVTAVVSASWKLSAEEPVRVAARPTTTAGAAERAQLTEPWQLLPGRTGYWSVNLEAVWKDPVMAQWLNTIELTFLMPGWRVIANEDGADRRGELGLLLTNIQTVGGDVTLKTERIDDPESEETYRSTAKSGEFVFHLRDKVDWKAVADSLARDRLDAAISGLVGPQFPEEQAQEFIEQDIIGRFFATQTDPHRLLLRQDVFKKESEEERPETAPAIPKLWNAHRGELATLVTEMPETPLGDTEFEKQLQAFSQSTEYYVIGIDAAERPGNVRIRLGFSPHEGTTLQQLQAQLAGLTKLGPAFFQRKIDDEEPDADTEAFVKFLEDATPIIIEPKLPGDVGIVEIQGEVPATVLPFVVTG